MDISLSFWACFWIQLEFPPLVCPGWLFFYLSKHSLYYSAWLGCKVEGRWGQKEGKHGQNAQHTQLLYTQAGGRGDVGQLSWSSAGTQAVALSLCCLHIRGMVTSRSWLKGLSPKRRVRQPSAAEGSCSGEADTWSTPELAEACGACPQKGWHGACAQTLVVCCCRDYDLGRPGGACCILSSKIPSQSESEGNIFAFMD